MPNPGSIVRMLDGRLAQVTNVSPKGDDDRVVIYGPDSRESKVTAWDISEVLYEHGEADNLSQP